MRGHRTPPSIPSRGNPTPIIHARSTITPCTIGTGPSIFVVGEQSLGCLTIGRRHHDGTLCESQNKARQHLPLQRFCREFFLADPSSGKMTESFYGQPYDCLQRPWYYDTKAYLTRRWGKIDVDVGTKSSIYASTRPLVNLTTQQGIPMRLHDESTGACRCGMHSDGEIEDLQLALAETFREYADHYVYVREPSTGKLVATSMSSSDVYYDSSAKDRILATVRRRAGTLV